MDLRKHLLPVFGVFVALIVLVSAVSNQTGGATAIALTLPGVILGVAVMSHLTRVLLARTGRRRIFKTHMALRRCP